MQPLSVEDVTTEELQEMMRALSVSVAAAKRILQLTHEELGAARSELQRDGLGARMLEDLQDSTARLFALAEWVATAENRLLALLSD